MAQGANSHHLVAGISSCIFIKKSLSSFYFDIFEVLFEMTDRMF
jgi:hypothetical protein